MSLNALSQPSFRGWVDLDALTDAAIELTPAAPGAPRRLSGAGVDVVVHDVTIRVVRTVAGISLVAGRPMGAGGAILKSDAELATAVAAAAANPGVSALGGRFAVVHIDPRRGMVHLVTDRFGVLPLCYALEGRRLAFSDRADGVPTRDMAALDVQALFNYMYFHVVPAPRTIFQGVARVEAARRLTFSSRGIESQKTWRPRFDASASGGKVPTFAEFRETVRGAVSSEVDREDIGAFLSGGTDSSTVAGMLREVTGKAPEVVSIGFEAAGYDEVEFARITARHFGCSHHVYYVTPADVAASIPLIAGAYDQPFGNSSALPAYYCATVGRDRGLGKLLAGDGGDELFGGNVRYAKQKVFDLYPRIVPGWLRRGLVEPMVLSPLPRSLALVRKVSSFVAQARVPMPDRAESYNLLDRLGAANLLSDCLLEAVHADEPRALQWQVYGEVTDAALVDRMLAYDWRFTLADNDLPKVVGTAALAGMCVGFPLLDDALVDFSLRLTPAQKVRGLTLRHWFKQALADFLPVEVIRKKKHGFGLPFGPWLVKDAQLMQLARDSIDGLIERGVLRPVAVDRLFSTELERFPGYYGEMIWILMMAEQWLRRATPSWKLT